MSNNATSVVDFELIFDALDAPYIIFAADHPDLTILAQNDAHVAIALQPREKTIGKKLLDAFPDTSDTFKKTGKSELVDSIYRVIKTGKPDSMPDLQYDLFNEAGEQVQKFWKVVHYPIARDGKIIAVCQATKDITEERLVKEQLDSTQSRLEEVLSTSLVGTWSLDLATQKVTADSNLATMFGIPGEQAHAGLELQRFVDCIYPADQASVQKKITAAIKSGELYEAEYRTVVANGDVRWVLARGNVKLDENNKPASFSGSIIDITERKQAEQALADSEARLRFMADSMPQLVWITRPDGYHEYYNRQWYEYTGTKPGSTDGEGWNDLFHPDDQKRAWKVWNRSLKTGEPYEIEYRLYHAPSGQYRWVIGRALPLLDAEGNITKWYGTCTDIDDQRRATEQQAYIADVTKELVTSLDLNKTLKKIAKLSVPMIADWCTVDLYSKERGFEQVSVAHADPKKVAIAKEYRKHNPLHIDDDTVIPRMLKTGKPEFYPVITKQMIEQYVEDKETLEFMKSLNICSMMMVPLKQDKKTVGAISFVSSDSGRYFTESDFKMANELGARVSLSFTNATLYEKSVNDLKRRRELEKQLRLEKQTLESRVKERTQQLQLTNQGLREEIIKRQAIESDLNEYSNELSRSNKELEDFAYVASHDLQEPLRKIQAFGNLLLSEYGDSLGLEGVDYLSRMHAAANRMSTLITDLLTFSRVSRRAPDTQPVNLNDVMNDVMSDLEARIEQTNATVTVEPLPTVEADPTHMRQLMQNLVGNAVKFHRAEVVPKVKVTSSEKDGGYEIRVTDNGIGFDEKYLDRIFAVFQRLNERSSYEGTGIGLAVCRKIVERYDGTITAESKKGRGSTFIIWLPQKKGTH